VCARAFQSVAGSISHKPARARMTSSGSSPARTTPACPAAASTRPSAATTHFNGQSTVVLDGQRATGESYTIAHHLFTADGERKIMIASLRYLDTFAKTGGTWLFAERNLILDWTETRPSAP
jgi:hypothetical protein